MDTIKNIIYIITAIIIPVGGFFIGIYKKIILQEKANKILLQNALTNVYFVYQNIGEIPDYAYKNWLGMLKVYEDLGGDDFIHDLADKMKSWKIIKSES